MGFILSSLIFFALIKTSADAPSFKVDALAAVTVPSFEKIGFKPGILAKSTFLYSSSSVNTKGSPFFCGIEMGTISFLNLPFNVASAALE